MSFTQEIGLQARKAPVQSRSAVTVDAIFEAAIQVLVAVGPDRLTTTRVAARAGVSVGTLYQYYPNKNALLFAVLERHLTRVVERVEAACAAHHHERLAEMMAAAVNAFVDAKMERLEVSMALYAIAAKLDGAQLSARIGGRARAAMAAMLRTASDAGFEELEFATLMLFAAMAGAARTVLEAGAESGMVRRLRSDTLSLCVGYLKEIEAAGRIEARVGMAVVSR